MLIRFYHSVCFAARGIRWAFATQPNFRFHILAAVLVFAIGVYTGLSTGEWLWIAAAVFFVLLAELFNTSIEELVNLVSPERKPQAGLVKDLAAGAVLLAAVFAIVVGALVFSPKIGYAA